MTAAALTAPLAPGRDQRPGLGRLTLVELRKMTDTRAGFWLQLAVVGLTLAVAGLIVAFGDPQDQTFEKMLGGTIQPSVNLLPVVGILLVSSEWSQRTAQISFTLVPRRSRVMAAKLLAATVMAVAAFAISILVALLATAVANPDVTGVWSLPAGMLGEFGVLLVIAMLGGLAFGAAMLASAPAIVLYYLLPAAWAAVGSIHAIEPVARWLDGSRSYAPMTDHLLSATEWARAGTTTLLWLAVPLLIGMWRITRNEVP
jgi:ABC-2 type transport system permease protein